MTHLDDKLRALPPSPREAGTVCQLAIRPTEGVHRQVESIELSPAQGVVGDRWSRGSWRSLPDGSPDPRVQVSVTNAGIMSMIAGTLKDALECGDNLFVDLDLSESNLPCGSRLRIGSALLEVSDVTNDACEKFARRFGMEAFEWIRRPENATLRLRGLFCQVIEPGAVRTGDRVAKEPGILA